MVQCPCTGRSAKKHLAIPGIDAALGDTSSIKQDIGQVMQRRPWHGSCRLDRVGHCQQCWYMAHRQLRWEGDCLQAGVELERAWLVGPIQKVPATIDAVVRMFGFFMVGQSQLSLPILHRGTPRLVVPCPKALCHTTLQTTMVFRWHMW